MGQDSKAQAGEANLTMHLPDLRRHGWRCRCNPPLTRELKGHFHFHRRTLRYNHVEASPVLLISKQSIEVVSSSRIAMRKLDASFMRSTISRVPFVHSFSHAPPCFSRTNKLRAPTTSGPCNLFRSQASLIGGPVNHSSSEIAARDRDRLLDS